jgi:hypothetical protein
MIELICFRGRDKSINARYIKFIAGLIATATLAAFVLGLAYSISTGAAGFWGGLPFWVITLSVLSLVIYDFWDDCIRKNH